MPALEELRAAQTRDDLAKLLGFTRSGLAYILFRMPLTQKYQAFEIPKRGGGKRQILAPEPSLALLQKRLAKRLYACLEELAAGSPPARKSLAHGFEKKRSIVTNASLHKRRRYVLNLDLEDFFPSINFGRVRGFFMKDKHLSLPEPVATAIAQIACHDGSLPQGSPSSPVISNLVGHLMDVRLARFAKRHKCTYSRYADDITFSTSQKEFPSEIASPNLAGGVQWVLGNELRSRIGDAGFRINEKKTRMQFRGSRQVTTGLMVNEKVNIRQEYWRAARHMCDSLFKTGSYYRKVAATLAGGAPGDPPVRFDYRSLGSIGGTLAYIHHVKDRSDYRSEKAKRDEPTAARCLYRRFLFFRNFVALQKPVIVPEGITDSIYLRCAIRSLASQYPTLADIIDAKPQLRIRFMNYSRTVHDVLQIGHGSGQLKNLIITYEKFCKTFAHCPQNHPVIILIDNDSGGQELFALIKGKANLMQVTFATSEPFYWLGRNLYAIKTPENGAAQTNIEDLFPSGVLATKVDGREFDHEDDKDSTGKYGKMTFATRVVEPNAGKIDFQGFIPLLDRFKAVLTDYYSRRNQFDAAAAN